MSSVKFELIEVGGFIAAIEGMRFPTKSVGDSVCPRDVRGFRDPGIELGPKDIHLITSLVKKGPIHSKFARGVIAWMRIRMPWGRFRTYPWQGFFQ